VVLREDQVKRETKTRKLVDEEASDIYSYSKY
jgi:hypothetical protein